MISSATLFSLLGAALLVPASPTLRDAATPFLGTGRLTALHDTDREYMGCITDAGLWTIDERQCGTFKGVSTDNYGGVHLSSALGICGVCNGCGLVFSCGKEGVETDFYVRVVAGVPEYSNRFKTNRHGLQGRYRCIFTLGISPPPIITHRTPIQLARRLSASNS
jgi:hypothetical protein